MGSKRVDNEFFFFFFWGFLIFIICYAFIGYFILFYFLVRKFNIKKD